MEKDIWSSIETFYEVKLTTDKSRNGYRSRIGEWFRFLGVIVRTKEGEQRLLNAKGFQVEEYIKLQRTRIGHTARSPGIPTTVSDSTIATKLISIRSLYRHLQKKEYLNHNPIDQADYKLAPYANRKRPTALVPFDLVKPMINSQDIDKECFRNRAYLALLFGGSMRRAEVSHTRIGNVQVLQDGTIFVLIPGPKSRHDREQVIAPFAHPYIHDYLAKRKAEGSFDVDYLFARPNGKRFKDHTLYHVYKNAALRVGLDPSKTSPHAARATGATKLLQDGVDHRRVQDFLGVSSVSVVEIYDKRSKSISNCAGHDLDYV